MPQKWPEGEAKEGEAEECCDVGPFVEEEAQHLHRIIQSEMRGQGLDSVAPFHSACPCFLGLLFDKTTGHAPRN